MKHQIRLAALVIVSAAIAAPAPVEAQDGRASVTGTYLFDQQVMMDDGAGGVATRQVQAQLRLEQHGDTIVGTWQILLPDGPGRPTEMRGTVSGNTVRLRTGIEVARLRGGGEERSIETTSEYIFTVEGDVINGSITTRSTDDMVQIPARSVSGRRA